MNPAVPVSYGEAGPTCVAVKAPLIQTFVIAGTASGCVPFAHLNVMFPVFEVEGTVA